MVRDDSSNSTDGMVVDRQFMETNCKMPGALEGLLVISVEQAVAAPYCAARLADAGARVIKIERWPEGDFARAYDAYVHGQSSYFVWLNRGKQSVHARLQGQGRSRAAASHDRQGRRADPEPGTGRRRTRGLRLGCDAGEEQATDHRRHLGLWRSRSLQEPPRLRPVSAGRERIGVDHRNRRGAGPCRCLGHRHRYWHVRSCRRAGSTAGPSEDR